MYDRKSKDPTYFIQVGVRNGKKVTTKNIARIGKHSELLQITDDPLAYAKEQVAKYNEEAKKNNKVDMDVHLDFAEKIKSTDEAVAYFGRIRTLIPATSGQRFGIIRTA